MIWSAWDVFAKVLWRVEFFIIEGLRWLLKCQMKHFFEVSTSRDVFCGWCSCARGSPADGFAAVEKLDSWHLLASLGRLFLCGHAGADAFCLWLILNWHSTWDFVGSMLDSRPGWNGDDSPTAEKYKQKSIVYTCPHDRDNTKQPAHSATAPANTQEEGTWLQPTGMKSSRSAHTLLTWVRAGVKSPLSWPRLDDRQLYGSLLLEYLAAELGWAWRSSQFWGLMAAYPLWRYPSFGCIVESNAMWCYCLFCTCVLSIQTNLTALMNVSGCCGHSVDFKIQGNLHLKMCAKGCIAAQAWCHFAQHVLARFEMGSGWFLFIF